jgi:hypothetical protein
MIQILFASEGIDPEQLIDPRYDPCRKRIVGIQFDRFPNLAA